MEVNYFKERARNANAKTKELLKILPSFCKEFFIGIEANTSPLTRLNYARDIKTFFEFLTENISEFKNLKINEFTYENIDQITSTHIELFLSYLNDYEKDGRNISNETRAKARKLSAIRSLLKYFFRKDKISSNIAEKVQTPKILDKDIVRLEVDEVVRILNEAEHASSMTKMQKGFNKHTRLRDVALLTLLLGTGIRVSECVGLNLNDIDFNVNGLRITRKGGKVSSLYFGDEVENALKSWLRHRENVMEIPAAETALFVSLQKKRLCVRSVEQLVKKYAAVSTPLKHITPHKLRSTYGTNLYRETKDIYIVADVLGHKDVNTTKKHYAALSEDMRRNVANKVKLRSN